MTENATSETTAARQSRERAMKIEADAPMECHRAPDAEGGVFRSYSFGWCGAPAVAEGLRAIFEGRAARVTYVVADHHLSGDVVHHRVVVARAHANGELRWRLCGERGDPLGAGSETFNYFGSDLVGAVADLVEQLTVERVRATNRTAATTARSHACNAVIFRQP